LRLIGLYGTYGRAVTVADPLSAADGRGTRAAAFRSRIVSAPGVAAAGTLSVLALAAVQTGRRGAWALPYFYDEEWRVDFIRSADIRAEMLTHDTPAAFGWVLLMKAVTGLLPGGPVWWRATTAVSLLLGLFALGLVVAQVLRRAVAPRALPPAAGLCVAGGLVLLGPVRFYLVYFQNYGFEVLYIALALLALLEAHQSRRALVVLCALIAASPAFVIGGLLAMPGVFTCAVWSVRRDPRRRPKLLALSGAGAAAVIVAAFFYIWIWRTVSQKPSISEYWVSKGASLGGTRSLTTLLHVLVQQFRDGAVGTPALRTGGLVLQLATGLLVISVTVGAVSAWRRWPPLLLVPVTAQVLAIANSAATHWPMTFERVNLSFQVLFLAIAALGLFTVLHWLLIRLRLPAWGLAPVLAITSFGFYFHHFAPNPHTFGRGLYVDVARVGQSSAPRNLVIQYHRLAHFYDHDLLINSSHPGHRFDIVSEIAGDPSLTRSIDPVLERPRLHTGDEVWCVIPFEVGTPAYYQDCTSTDPRLHEILDTRGSGDRIRAFLVV
jgi:hypothetical protein